MPCTSSTASSKASGRPSARAWRSATARAHDDVAEQARRLARRPRPRRASGCAAGGSPDRPAGAPASSSGNASTSVTRLEPRCSRLSAAHAALADERLRRARRRARPRPPARRRRARATAASSTAQRVRLTTSTATAHGSSPSRPGALRPRGRRASAWPPARSSCVLVGGHDALHELVAHHVAAVEVDEGDVVDRRAAPRAPSPAPTVRPPGRSICVTSPVTTILEPKPRRVRNIFICSGVVFCASSRMMNESLSVRPRMKASGATSISPFSMSAAELLAVDHVVERVEQRPEVRVDLLRDGAGQEAEALPRLHRRPREDDAADLLAEEARSPPWPWPGRSCRCRPGRCRR